MRFPNGQREQDSSVAFGGSRDEPSLACPTLTLRLIETGDKDKRPDPSRIVLEQQLHDLPEAAIR